MDDLLSSFSAALSTNKDVHCHSAFYKMQGDPILSQEKRRMDLLKAQKEKRNSQVNASRGILDLIKEADSEEGVKGKKSKQTYKPKVFVPGFTKKKPFYSDTLMLSEWMNNVPEDLHSQWLVLACPKGTRVLVVASRGRTIAYSKFGHFYKEFRSTLPGGLNSDYKCDKHCVLDCIINDKFNYLFVLDVLAWGDLSMTECELQFREYWLKSKFEESPHLGTQSKVNNYKIHLVQKFECSRENLSNVLSLWPAYTDNCPAVDGLLFYHKEAYYVKGYTPLVVWLFPFMVNEVLGSDINVNEKYMEERPKDYVNQEKYIEEFEKKQAEKTKKKEIYSRRRGQSFSSTSSSSSLNSSLSSNHSDSVPVVFSARKSNSRDVEVEDMDLPEVEKIGESEGNGVAVKEMEVVGNSSIDSAVCFMDDSVADTSNAECDTSACK